MAAHSTAQKRSSSPCGCGGGSSNSSPCTCGGSCGGTCAICQGVGYTRPRFFAGQLLTEDDLQQLNDYVVAKNRLHASHLFGSGVVCGLEVTCYPCGGGKVIVNPGYALDCCGNDIVVACSQELDINQMVRDLQRKMRGGFDCGDPCADTKAGTTKKTPGQFTPTDVESEPGDQESGEGVKLPEFQKYCLYINYCEQLTDPVAPYATDDPCGPASCEATRTREGFRFELRCPDPTEPTPEICSRFWGCLGDRTAYEGFSKAAGQLGRHGEQIVGAFQAIQKSRTPKPPEKFAAYLKTNVESAAAAVEAFHKAEELKKKNNTPIPLPVAQDVIDAAQALGRDLAIYVTVDESGRKILDGQLETEQIRSAVTHLTAASQVIERAELQELLATDLEKAHAASLAEVTQKLSKLLLSRGEMAAEFAGEKAAEIPPRGGALTQDVTIRFLAEGAVAGRSLYNEMVTNTDSLQAWLVYRLEQEAMKTRCSLLDTLGGAPKLPIATTPDIRMDAYYGAGRAASIAARVFWELLRTCMCTALNPPCPECEDTGVLLACLTMEECKVKDICNLDRQFVLSPVATRYWVPQITLLGEALEEFCCPDPCLQKPDYELGGKLDTVYPRKISEMAYFRLIYQFFASSCFEKHKARGHLANLFLGAIGGGIPGRLVPEELGRSGQMAAAEPAGGVAPEAPAEPDLLTKLMKTRLEMEKLRADYTRLLDRVGRLEKKRGTESRDVHE